MTASYCVLVVVLVAVAVITGAFEILLTNISSALNCNAFKYNLV